MLEGITEAVNSQLETQGVPTPKTDGSNNGSGSAPAAAMPPSNGGDDLLGRLSEAVAEIEAIKAERAREEAEREAAVAAERLKVASAIAKQPSPRLALPSRTSRSTKPLLR